jgi:site-specific DNA recombinase
MEHRAGLSSARTELSTVEREIRSLVQAIKDGVSALSIKDELLSLEARKAELQSRLNASEMPELLHPRMADVYREKVGSLCSALQTEQGRTSAVEAIRALIDTIVLEPEGDELKITLKGDLAGMLSAARDSSGDSRPEHDIGPVTSSWPVFAALVPKLFPSPVIT